MLLVDDRAENLTALEAVLAPLAAEMGARLRTAGSAAEALRHVLAEGDALAIVLLDVQMPGTDGLETARLIRGRTRTGHVPIIFVTAHDADARAVAAGYAAGAVDYLFKPLAVGAVRAKVRTFVELYTHREAARRAAAAAAANAQLAAHARELEDANRQLQDQAAELELQAEMLRESAVELEERTEAALRTAAALAETEARYRLAADAAELGTWTWDVATDSATFDARVRGLFAFPGEDPQSRADILLTRVHPDDRADVAAALAEAANPAGDGRYDAEFRVVRPDGTERWARAAGLMRFDGAGGERRPAHLVGTVLDVTERRRAEAAVVESERQLRTMVDALPALAWTARADGYIDWYNAGWYAYTGTTPGEMAGWGWQRVHDPAVLPAVLERWAASIASGAPFEMTFPLRGADRRFRAFLTRVAPVRDAAGRVIRWVGTNTDVEAERAARAEAEAANRAKSEFLSTMSHELRTPLNAIGGYAELLAMGIRGPVTEAQQEDLGRLLRANRHLMGLVTDVLNFTRLDAGQVEYAVADVSIAAIVADVEALVAPQFAAKGLRFDHDACGADTPETPHAVRGDAEKVRQILLNLLTNALKFTAAGGQVALACETDRGAGVVRMTIADTGRGIPPHQLERVFEPFVQVDRHRTPERQQGVGLGLAISRDLARGMGGDLTAASVLDVGSTFTLTLPRA